MPPVSSVRQRLHPSVQVQRGCIFVTGASSSLVAGDLPGEFGLPITELLGDLFAAPSAGYANTPDVRPCASMESRADGGRSGLM